MIETKETLQSYLETFEQFEKQAPGHDLPWLKSLRREAFARFWELGLPTLRDEDWRFTNISAIANNSFRLAELEPVEASALDVLVPEGIQQRLVFVNGQYSPELSNTSSPSSKVTVLSLRQALSSQAGLVQRYLGTESFQTEAFTALNTAFLADGAFVHIRRGAVVESPIYVLYISTSNGSARMAHPRNLIVAEENTQATVVEDYVTLSQDRQLPANSAKNGSAPFFSNVVTELIAGQDSIVSHCMVEREDASALNVSTLRIQQERNANVDSHSILVGGALVRNNVHPVLTGEGSECLINGLFVANGRQHMDNFMKVEHAAPHCNSRQFYNGILDGHSHGVFHGRIIVHKDAQKTDAKQTNRNLLLSDEAQIDTKPQLEIYADDVKCTHGATIGQIDEEALFYMRSRGLEESDARRLLLYAFASECLDRMKPGVIRSWLEAKVPGWLPQKNTSGAKQ